MIHIRNFRDTDSPFLHQLFFNTIRNINRRDYSQAQVNAWASDDLDAKYWIQRMRGLQPFVAEIEGTIVGYTDLQDDGLIDHFFCHHEFQGRGVGRALMQHVFSEAKRREIHSLHSHVSITAKPFYQRMGFSVAEQQKVNVGDEILTNFVMKKNLQQ